MQIYVFLQKTIVMQFRPGDKVKFKDEQEQGIVVKTDENGWVIVKTTDGFERPVDPDDLMLTGMNDTATVFKETDIEELSPTVEEKTDEEDRLPVGENDPLIYLGIVQKEEKFAFYLINDSDYNLFFSFGELSGGKYARLIDKDFLEDNTKVLLAELLPEGEKNLFIQCLFFGEHRFIPRPACDRQIPFGISSIPRAREFRENPYFDEKAWLIPLMKEQQEKIVMTKGQKTKILKEKGDLPGRRMMLRPEIAGNEPIEEVDLHVETFIDDPSGMSNGEILEVQLSRFEIALEGAIKHKQKKIVFIHGLGQGKLKHEIRKRLDKKKIRYQDASFKEYGYGATLVILKK